MHTCEHCKQEIKEEKKVKKQILNRWNQAVLFEYEGELKTANLTRANLTDADLTDADLTRANLTGADLTRAKTAYTKVNFSPDEYEQAKKFIEGLKR